MRLLLILICTARVYPEMQTMKRSMYVSRKSRSYSMPMETGYLYSDYTYNPGIYSGYSDSHHRPYDAGEDSNEYKYSSVPSYKDFHTLTKPLSEHISEPLDTTSAPPITTSFPVTEYYEEPTTKFDIDFERRKSEARYNSKFLPAKIRSDIMYERLKSLMHYKPYSDRKINEIEFDMSKEYHSDDDNDIRTTSRSYDGFPYFYHGPYDYEYESPVEKGIGKRYTAENYHSVIPVHENIVDDIPPNHYTKPTYLPSHHLSGTRAVSTEKSPVSGDTGFFSYVLNDYYDKTNEEDPLVFKVGEWGKEINYDALDDDINRPTRQKKKKKAFRFYTTPSSITKNGKEAYGNAVTEKGRETSKKYDKGSKYFDEKVRDKAGYDNHKANHQGFKDIADAVAHKFGTEKHNRESKFEINHNQDKGENRKGFHRVYHKDEYMEDKEFFDNSNSSSRGKDKGSSLVNNGGSEVTLKSLATANIGDESNASRKAGDRVKLNSDSSHKGHSQSSDSESEFDRYREVAREAVNSNGADYADDELVLLR